MTSDARFIAELRAAKPSDVVPFPTYELLQRLRANGAMQEAPVAGQCSMAALLDCRATLQAIFNQNVTCLDAEPAASFECHRRVKEQPILSGAIGILDTIINAKRIGP